MNPIEKVHQQILGGNVLGPSGTWISRNDALKRKRFLLKHVLAGEVEVDGKWINLSDVETRPKRAPILSMQQQVSYGSDANNIPRHKKRSYQPEDSAPSSTPFSPDDEPAILRHSSVHQGDPNYPPGLAAQLAASRTDDTIDMYSGQAISPEKQTVTIRSISLGKETTLTISESRAGTALVAVCSIQGYIDQTNADEFHTQLMSMLDFGVRFFIIDFEHTNLIGSAGWAIIAVASRLIKAAQGHLLICNMSNDIEESYYLMQFNEVIEAKKTITDCLTHIDQLHIAMKSNAVDHGHDSQPLSIFGDSYDDIPIQEKIKSIISRYGPVSFFQIKKILKQQQYGRVEINSLQLYLLLKELNLESNLKRKRFYRSC